MYSQIYDFDVTNENKHARSEINEQTSPRLQVCNLLLTAPATNGKMWDLKKHPHHVLSIAAFTVPWLTKKFRVRDIGLGLGLWFSGVVVFLAGAFYKRSQVCSLGTDLPKLM